MFVQLTELDFIELVETRRYNNISLSKEDIEDISRGGIVEKVSEKYYYEFILKDVDFYRIIEIMDKYGL